MTSLAPKHNVLWLSNRGKRSADLQSQAEPPCRKDDDRSGPEAKLKQGRGDFLDDVLHLRIRRMKWSLVVRACPFDGVRDDLRFRRIRKMSAVRVIIGWAGGRIQAHRLCDRVLASARG